jgi:hypothetical protein
MNRYIKTLAMVLVAGALVACGGGGGSSGSSGGGTGGGSGGGTGDPTTPEIASLIYQLSKPTINNGGSDSTLLTVTALDADNNPVAGVPLAVAVDSGVYTPNNSVTDGSGQASGNITIGADKANRNITARLTLGSKRATAVVEVIGSAITLTPLPVTPAPGAPVQVGVKVNDFNGAAIPGVSVRFSGSLGLTGAVVTDNNGNATGRLAAAPRAPGQYVVKAAALGVESERQVQVVGSAGNGIPAATGTISSASLAIVPNTIPPNATGSQTSRAVVKAKFINPQNQAVQNVRVRFVIDPPKLGAGEKISTDNATVYSDVNGEATADYIAGTRSSPTDGVTIRACYGLTDASILNCNTSVTQTLTVAGQPLSITLGDNNQLAKGNSDLTYIKMFDVAVADAAGNAVVDAVISASVDITRYAKGQFNGPTVGCLNEDANRNGSLDNREDLNGNNSIEPRKADVILSFLGTNKTGATGRMTIQIEYPQNVATWLEYTVRVTTNVAGSEGTYAKRFKTEFIRGDEVNGSFLTAPYGEMLNCRVPD